MKKIICYSFFVLGCSLFVACGGKEEASTSEETSDEITEPLDPIEAGKLIYLSNCKLCHGEDGTLGSSGSANLKISVLKTQDLNNVVTYGKGNMTGFKGLIEPADIKNVVAYIETLRKK